MCSSQGSQEACTRGLEAVRGFAVTMDQGGSYRKFVNEDTVTETEMSLIG